jgi:hypothetical protein
LNPDHNADPSGGKLNLLNDMSGVKKRGINLEYNIGGGYYELLFVLDGPFLLGYKVGVKTRPRGGVDEYSTYAATLLCANKEVSIRVYELITQLELGTPTSMLYELADGLFEHRHGDFLPSDLKPDATNTISGNSDLVDDYIQSLIKASQELGQWVSQKLPESITSCDESTADFMESPYFQETSKGKYCLTPIAIDLIAAKNFIHN